MVVVMAAQPHECARCHRPVHLKLVKMTNFTWCVFYHDEEVLMCIACPEGGLALWTGFAVMLAMTMAKMMTTSMAMRMVTAV